MLTTWNKEYYDALSFYYWEPQHLGKLKNPKSKYNNVKDVLSHLKKMEVSLNHQFNLFFQLLPNELFHQFFGSIVQNLELDDYKYQSLENLKILNLNDATQPDIFFKGNNNLIGVELKVGAKTNLDQVMKYAMLYHFSQTNDDKNKNNHLVYFGCGEFHNLFKDNKTTIQSLKDEMSLDMIPDITKKGKISLKEVKESILDIAQQMTITYISYKEIYLLFDHLKSQIEIESQYSSTIIKLIEGMQNELSERKLNI